MDNIQRKLALIDKQLSGYNYQNHIISTCPLLLLSTGLIAGIVIQSSFNLSILFWLILMSLCGVASFIVFIILKSTPNSRFVIAYLAIGVFLCLGAIRLINSQQLKQNDISLLVGDSPTLAAIRGTIITEPYINENKNWKFAQFQFSDPGSSFYLKITHVQSTNGWTKTEGTVYAFVNEPVIDLNQGDSIQAYCLLDRFNQPTNPGQFDIKKYMAGRNIFLSASIESRDGIELLERNNSDLISQAKNKVRNIARQALLDNTTIDEPGRGLLQALLLGYRKDINSETYQAFQKTGLLHFISLSGLHVGILIGIIWWLSKTLGLMKPARSVICIIVLVAFLLIVPARAPTLRAAIICFVFCIAIFLRRHPNPVNTLSLSAIILLLVWPNQLFEPGWQLSFATVLGILMFYDRIYEFLQSRIVAPLQNKNNKNQSNSKKLINKTIDSIIKLFSTGFSAWLGGAGILLYHFHKINPLASFWTVLVFPLIAAILLLGFFKMLIFFILPTLSGLITIVIILLTGLLIRIVQLIANLGFSQILIGRVPLIFVLLFYATLAFAAFARLRNHFHKKIILITSFAFIILLLGSIKWQRTNRDNLVLTCLDVGHGQAIAVQLPGCLNIILDAGSMYKTDIGRQIVTPFTDYAGISRIEAIIISHNDLDHINGIPEIVEHLPVNHIYANEAFLDKTDIWGTASFLKECISQAGLEIESINGILNFNGNTDIKILWPIEETANYNSLSDNDKSLVFLINYADVNILICSDIEQFAQKEIMNLYPDLRADIVVMPHHGSVNTLEPGFIENLDAKIQIYSCSQSQLQNPDIPDETVINNLNITQSFYTSRDGAITLTIDKDGNIRSRIFKE